AVQAAIEQEKREVLRALRGKIERAAADERHGQGRDRLAREERSEIGHGDLRFRRRRPPVRRLGEVGGRSGSSAAKAARTIALNSCRMASFGGREDSRRAMRARTTRSR